MRAGRGHGAPAPAHRGQEGVGVHNPTTSDADNPVRRARQSPAQAASDRAWEPRTARAHGAPQLSLGSGTTTVKHGNPNQSKLGHQEQARAQRPLQGSLAGRQFSPVPTGSSVPVRPSSRAPDTTGDPLWPAQWSWSPSHDDCRGGPPSLLWRPIRLRNTPSTIKPGRCVPYPQSLDAHPSKRRPRRIQTCQNSQAPAAPRLRHSRMHGACHLTF